MFFIKLMPNPICSFEIHDGTLTINSIDIMS